MEKIEMEYRTLWLCASVMEWSAFRKQLSYYLAFSVQNNHGCWLHADIRGQLTSRNNIEIIRHKYSGLGTRRDKKLSFVEEWISSEIIKASFILY